MKDVENNFTTRPATLAICFADFKLDLTIDAMIRNY